MQSPVPCASATVAREGSIQSQRLPAELFQAPRGASLHASCKLGCLTIPARPSRTWDWSTFWIAQLSAASIGSASRQALTKLSDLGYEGFFGRPHIWGEGRKRQLQASLKDLKFRHGSEPSRGDCGSFRSFWTSVPKHPGLTRRETRIGPPGTVHCSSGFSHRLILSSYSALGWPSFNFVTSYGFCLSYPRLV